MSVAVGKEAPSMLRSEGVTVIASHGDQLVDNVTVSIGKRGLYHALVRKGVAVVLSASLGSMLLWGNG